MAKSNLICVLAMTGAIAAVQMFPDRMVQADPIEQTIILTEQLATLTKRMNELELLHSSDVNELTKRVQELSDSRKNDLSEITQLNKEVKELKRLCVEDSDMTSMFIQRIKNLERVRDKDKIPHYSDKPYNKGSNLTLRSPAETTSNESTTAEEDKPKHGRPTSSISSDEKRRIKSGHHRITRVSPQEDVVAFHAILTHQISDPSTNHVIKYNHVITNTGGAHYNTDTGIFTCTQTGVYVFSWSIFEAGHHFIFTDLVRNNAVIGSAQTGQDTGFSIASSATVAVHLEVGDVVSVRVKGHGTGSDIQPNLSMFTGFRL